MRPAILKRSRLDTNNTSGGNELNYQCIRCSYASNNSSNLGRHLEAYHVGYPCKYCPVVAYGRTGLQKHLKKTHDLTIKLQEYFNGNAEKYNIEEKIVKIKHVNDTKKDDSKRKVPIKKIVKSKKKSRVSNFKEMIPYCKIPTAKDHLNKAKKASSNSDSFLALFK
jgi:hypothetical protein